MGAFYIGSGGVSGPLTDASVRDLVRVGTIGKGTLVWFTGETGWVNFFEVDSERLLEAARNDPEGNAAPPAAEVEVCLASGEIGLKEEMIPYGDGFVKAEYKDVFVQGLGEGTPEEKPPLELEATGELRDILIQTFAIAKERWGLLLVLLVWTDALYYCFFDLGVYYFFPEMSDAAYSTLENVVTYPLYTFTAGVCYSLASGCWFGRRESVGQIYSSAFRRLVPLLFVRILCSMAVGVGIIILVIPGLYLLVRLLFAEAKVFDEERMPVMSAIMGSWDITVGRFWRVALICLVYVVALIAPIIGLIASDFDLGMGSSVLYYICMELQSIVLIFGSIFLFSAMKHVEV